MKKSVFSVALLCLIGFSCSQEDDGSEITLREPASSVNCSVAPSAINCTQVLGQWVCGWTGGDTGYTDVMYPADGSSIEMCGLLDLTFSGHLFTHGYTSYKYEIFRLVGSSWVFASQDSWNITNNCIEPNCPPVPSQHLPNVYDVPVNGTYRIQLFYSSEGVTPLATSIVDITADV